MAKEKEPEKEPEKETKKRPARVSQYAGKGKPVTVPMMKLNDGDTVALEFTGETRQQKIGDKSKEPATLLRATDLDSGEIVDVIAPTVLLSTLDREYPDGIAQKKLVLKISKRADKRYHDVAVSEL